MGRRSAALAQALDHARVQASGRVAEGGDAEGAVLDRLVAEACIFALASHAYWGVWSYVQVRGGQRVAAAGSQPSARTQPRTVLLPGAQGAC